MTATGAFNPRATVCSTSRASIMVMIDSAWCLITSLETGSSSLPSTRPRMSVSLARRAWWPSTLRSSSRSSQPGTPTSVANVGFQSIMAWNVSSESEVTLSFLAVLEPL